MNSICISSLIIGNNHMIRQLLSSWSSYSNDCAWSSPRIFAPESFLTVVSVAATLESTEDLAAIGVEESFSPVAGLPWYDWLESFCPVSWSGDVLALPGADAIVNPGPIALLMNRLESGFPNGDVTTLSGDVTGWLADVTFCPMTVLVDWLRRNVRRLFSWGWIAWKNGVYPWLQNEANKIFSKAVIWMS